MVNQKTGQRAHHTNLNALDSLVVNVGTVSALLLECEGNAHDGCGNVGVGVVELKVTLESRDLVVLLGIKGLDGGDHRVAPATILHTLEVPRALQVLVTHADGDTIALAKLNLILIGMLCHLLSHSLVGS